MILILLCCITFDDIQHDYYSEKSLAVATVDVGKLPFTGDSLNIALNRIARANYKHERYNRAYQIAERIEADQGKLKWDTLSLKALLSKNTGKYSQADSLFNKVISDAEYRDVLFEAYLNYGEYHRVMMDYKSREYNLLQALSYAEGWQRNKVIRVLTRHYFNIELDFDKARRMIASHDDYESLDTEGKAGYRLLQAQMAEAEQSYEEAAEYYRKANRVAQMAGFVQFQHDAADGVMRSNILIRQVHRRDLFIYAFNVLLVLFILLVGVLNHKWGKK